MKPEAHGGDRLRMAALAGRAPDSLLDFSVNVRPEGAPEFLRLALCRALDHISAYPSPHAEEAMEAAARVYGLPADCFVFGNGTNELIHLLARVLKEDGTPCAAVIEPAFSEYALACGLAGLEVRHPDCGVRRDGDSDEDMLRQLLSLLTDIPARAAVWLANPGNPSGSFLPPASCRRLLEARPDLLWIIDEAFAAYAGPDDVSSLITQLPDNAVLLRSLTKFHAVPGVRLGYMVTRAERARRWRRQLPAWSVNAFALAAAQAVLADTSDFADRTRDENRRRREHLCACLRDVPSITVFPSLANYVLFRCEQAPADLYARLLREYGIAVRDCSNYRGMEDGSWFRAAVRLEEDHQRLADALRGILHPSVPVPPRPRSRRPALMLQGTSSDAGKSILAAAFCRILRQDGYDVAPFKAQNMSLNSGVTAMGEEMGRAQIVQAQAARIDPEALMNPVLLKPHSETGSQVIVLGKPVGHMQAREYFRYKAGLWQTVRDAYDTLADRHEVMVLEGAGSPGEVNLKQHDIVNMRMAAHAQASVLLVGDIDRGGVYASLLGTWMTLEQQERSLLAGWLVNKFRGDASFLEPAHAYVRQATGIPVLGVIPWLRNINIPDEDMAGFPWSQAADTTPPPPGILDIAVVMPRHVSNFTDMTPLAAEPDVRLRAVRRAEDWGQPHVVILPGTKSVAADLAALRADGLAELICRHAARDGWLLGICGGLQMLGRAILDPLGLESAAPSVPGLGLMDLESTFAADKTLVSVRRAATPLPVMTGGYEIHHGHTSHGPSALPLFVREGQGAPEERICGYVSGRRWATYLHGLFDDDAFRRAWLDHVRQDVGLKPQGRQLVRCDLEASLDRLADVVRQNVDMKAIYKRLGL